MTCGDESVSEKADLPVMRTRGGCRGEGFKLIDKTEGKERESKGFRGL